MSARDRETRFLHAISHKLRTPLTVIGGSLDLMTHLPPERLPQAWERILPICRRQVRRLDATVGRLLEFRELSEAEQRAAMAPVDLASVIGAAEAGLRRRYPDVAIEFEATIAPGAHRALASADDVSLVIEELADNAVEFAQRYPVRVQVAIDRDADGALRLAVTDNGPGIPHEHLDRIFEGYVQIGREEAGQMQGLGLGMRIVRQVAQSHGGSVAVRSELGRGTTVTVTFATDDEAAPTATSLPASGASIREQ